MAETIAACSIFSYETRAGRRVRRSAFLGAGAQTLHAPAPHLQPPSRKFCLTFPSCSPSLGAAWHPGQGPGVVAPQGGPDLPLASPSCCSKCPSPPYLLATHEPGMGEGQQNGLGLFFCFCFFFARTLIWCGNQRLKVTYTAIASHAEPNIHRRKYCVNYNAEQHSISAIVPLQL